MTDFTSLYESFAADVFRFALYLCGNPSDAEDITSETFVRAWTSQEEIRTETVKGYLFTIARNLFLKQARAASRNVELDENLRDSQPSAYDRVQQRAEAAAVLEAMQGLPAIDRAALIMRTFDELSYREIAQVLEITETAAKVKVHRARASLMNIRRA
ncbi:MAG: sigma-70 family RNA polymerase sigma factor [Terracidiphilus sp.]|jgi:RNA polymerase sigma-70 factor (ECF subfamily)